MKASMKSMLAPCVNFTDQDEYVWRHEQGTVIEMDNEEKAMKRLNNKRLPFRAWPIAPIPGLTTAFSKSWLFLVKVPAGDAAEAFPSVADRFTIDLDSIVHRREGKFSLVHLPASRIPNPYETIDADEVQKCAAFKVDVPRSWKAGDGPYQEMDLMATFQTASSISNTDSISLDPDKQQTIFVQFDASCLTFEAELAALRHLTAQHRLQEMAPSKLSLDAFKMLQNFSSRGWISFRNLHDEFPQLRNPCHRSHRVPKLIVEKFKAFNADHRAALKGLQSIPNSVYFVNGCPGAGKTEWNMVLSALVHSKRSPKSRRRHTPILFLVDINKAVDDAANRYYRLCQDAGLKRLRIIRMHSWPYEIRHSAKLNKGSDDVDAEPDFTKKFLTTASLAQHIEKQRNARQAPTLDEASWEYYERHKGDCFQALCKLLTRMDEGDVLDNEDWKALRKLVSLLYRAVLAQTDFVATTPVAAFGHFSKLFRPDLVVMDEAPHARELTSLIPIAFYSPLAWIFTGDVNQTRPFVKNDDKRSAERAGLQFNPFAEQLRTSIMARAAAVDAINSKLLVNKRSFANLHRLPSKLFYEGQMSSGYDEASLYPPSTLYLKGYLERLGGVQDIGENRLVVRLKGGEEHKLRESFWNPAHHEWVLAQVRLLLQDESFDTMTGSGKGTVMIATPYSTAVRQYHASVKTWPDEWQDRIEVLTVDKAQGNEADVVFLDLVRTERPGFMDDPKRLNVAISRARQAEVIVMHPCMTFRRVEGGRRIRSRYLSQVWDDAVASGRLATL
ncbi:hypothetical protein L249_8288 [Ophiocordyceps polyrhachis-furcata BCC 54312]|uniref:DNA2/NAM7 helicase-like C-terminal domain-containing protein n=1 Tax=Ophiocordyceps polyrhachis-furcata BCC 54312 TaxID=1330021 RepID=A0A367LHD0_9HYPO|nr:hypothetical protein L249_8288 [Ophiocordyceps polyrhachis-furcata BCC 54312]